MDSNIVSKENYFEQYEKIWRLFKSGMYFEQVCIACGMQSSQSLTNKRGDFNDLFYLINEVCEKDFEGSRIFFDGEKIV